MKNEILTHLNNPGQLEKMYRTNKAYFVQEFSNLYPELKGNSLADFWNERLSYESKGFSRGAGKDWLFVLIASLVAGIIAKVPQLFQINEEFFYPRNIGFIIFPVLTAYFSWKTSLSTTRTAMVAAAFLFALLFINSLPAIENSDTTVLACIHLLLFLWSLLGFAFTGDEHNKLENRLDFLKYNGDLIVITTLILIAGGIMSGLTIGLFSLIGLHIEEFYFRNVVVFGLPAAPILGTYLIRTNPQLIGKVSTVIAKIFSPLVLVMLIIYLGAMLYSGKDPYNDREFLLVFNALLIGVMAIIFFSVAGTDQAKSVRIENWVLFLLSLATILVNGIALSAILFRISEWGITPNRAAVLGGNLLILVNLFLVASQLYKTLSQKKDLTGVGKTIGIFLPVYCLWAIIVTFLFPFIFDFA